MPTTTPLTRIALLAAAAVSITSCGKEQNSDIFTKLIEERDSLIMVSNAQNERLESINSLMSTINHAVDSISESEEILFFNADKEGKFSRQDALNDLARYEMLLKRQQQKIEELRIRFGEDNPESGGIIKVMRQQLEAKDRMIDQLKKELAKKDVDITRLRKTVSSQTATITKQEQTITELGKANEAKTQALLNQDKIINQCFVMIASKKELESKGIIKKGRIVSDKAINNSAFMKVDIRKAREFAFQAKKPKILSNMPQSSYMLINNGGNNYSLRVTDPTAFWGISNYLVIQTE